MRNVPAFPCNSPDGIESYKGMDLRDYIAIHVLPALIHLEDGPIMESINRHGYSRTAYDLADEMLAVRATDKAYGDERSL